MRLVCEPWIMLDAKSSVATDEKQAIENQNVDNSLVVNDELENNSTSAIVELQNILGRAFALAGRLSHITDSQGVALG